MSSAPGHEPEAEAEPAPGMEVQPRAPAAPPKKRKGGGFISVLSKWQGCGWPTFFHCVGAVVQTRPSRANSAGAGRLICAFKAATAIIWYVKAFL